MLYKSLSSNNFKKFAKISSKFHTPSTILFYQKNSVLDLDPRENYVGLIVSKKNGSAVTRNKIKRRFRSIIQGYLNKSDFNQNVIVLMPRKNFLDFSFTTIESQIITAISKIKNN